MYSPRFLVVPLSVLLTTSAFADFRYTEQTQITGGAAMGMMKMAGAFSKDAKQAMQPVTSTVFVKGNRMARVNPDETEIIDLDRETITHIDHRKKVYTVTTFQQMKQQMEEAQRRAKEQQAKEPRKEEPRSTEPPPKMEFSVKVRNTGATKTVANLNASESILTMTLEGQDQKTGDKGAFAMTNDMWMVPEIPGYAEVRDFQIRLGRKMGEMFSGSMRPHMSALAAQPGSAQGMSKMVEEMSKLKGVPVMQVMRMGATTNGQPLPAASEAPLPQNNGPEMPSKSEVAKESAASAITSKLGIGGFGGFGKKKKKEEPPPEAANTQANAAAGVLMEAVTEISSFSTQPIQGAEFDVPAGYARVEPRMDNGASSNQKITRTFDAGNKKGSPRGEPFVRIDFVS